METVHKRILWTGSGAKMNILVSSRRSFFFAVLLCIVGKSSDAQQSPATTRGKELFNKGWTHNDVRDPFVNPIRPRANSNEVGDGLGPLYNAKSCAECHKNGGSAATDRGSDPARQGGQAPPTASPIGYTAA